MALRARHVAPAAASLVWLSFALLVLSCGDPEPTEDGPPALATSPVAFGYDERLFAGQSYDTGWLPSGSHVQVRFFVSARAQLTSSAKGNARLSRDVDGGLGLEYRGTTGGGQLAMDIGLELACQMKISYSPPIGPSLKWEGAIPFAPAWDFRFADSATFTPFLLEGAPGRPVHLEDEAQKKELFRVPLPGLSIPYVGGGFVMAKAGGKLAIDFSGERIETTPDGGAALTVDREGQRARWPDGKDTGQAVYRGQARFSGTLVIAPTASVATSIGGKSLDLAEFPINIDVARLGLTTQTLTFKPQAVSLATR